MIWQGCPIATHVGGPAEAGAAESAAAGDGLVGGGGGATVGGAGAVCGAAPDGAIAVSARQAERATIHVNPAIFELRMNRTLRTSIAVVSSAIEGCTRRAHPRGLMPWTLTPLSPLGRARG